MLLFIKLILRDIFFFTIKYAASFTNIVFLPFKLHKQKQLIQDIKNKRIRKVIILRNDQIGDAVISLSLIRAIAKKFESTTIVVSKKNSFIFKNEKNLKLIIAKDKQLYQFSTILSKIFSFIYNSILYAIETFSLKTKPKYDLLIDLCGDISALRKYPSKYIIGPNRLLFSLFYTCWYKTTFAVAGSEKKHLLESYTQMLHDCLGLEIKLKDKPPENFIPTKKNQIFVFVGCVAKRNLSYELWKNIILFTSKYSNCIVADDPAQLIMDKLKEDPEVLTNPKVKLIKKAKTLDYLAKIANQSFLLIGVDGGGQHFLERYTNALVIYTSGLPHQWKPYSLIPYRIRFLPDDHVLEYTKTAAGLYKFVLYRGYNRKPSYDLLDDFPYFKNLDINIISQITESFLKTHKPKSFNF